MVAAPWTPTAAPRLDGRVAVVTGATGGLGLATALGLAGQGATVVLTGRNPDKGAAALARVRAGHPGVAASFELLDLASLAGIKAAAECLATSHPAIAILVNNAGVMSPPRRRTTADGFELQLGTNYLGHFALTAHLLPALLAAPGGARVVSVSSIAHRRAKLDFADLGGERRYSPMASYAQSKLAMLVHARELQRRATAAGMPLTSIAAHPGLAVTDIIANGPGGGKPGLKEAVMQAAFRFAGQSAAAGALPMLYAAFAPAAVPGGYYGPDGPFEFRGNVGPAGVMPQAADPATARRLWTVSEQLTGVRYPGLD